MLSKLLLPILIFAGGLFCHAVGATFTEADEQLAAHVAGGILNIGGLLVGWVKSKRTPMVGLMLALICLPGLVGCQTSEPFRVGVYMLGQPIAEQATGYADGAFGAGASAIGVTLADEVVDRADDAPLSPSAIAERKLQAQAFADAVNDKGAIQYEVVKSTWADVRPWFMPTLDRDPDREKYSIGFELLDEAVVWFERLIQVEGIRRSIFGDKDEAQAELQNLVNDIKAARGE